MIMSLEWGGGCIVCRESSLSLLMVLLEDISLAIQSPSAIMRIKSVKKGI